MRIFITTAICSLVLWAAPLFASDGRVLVEADWEREADAALWTEHVIESVQSGDEEPMPVNAFCDEEVFKILRDLRNEAAAVVEESIETGEYTVQARIAANLLQQVQIADVSDVIYFEDNILMNTRYGYDLACPMKHNRGIAKENNVPCIAAISVTAVSTLSSKTNNSKKQDRTRKPPSVLVSNIQLNYAIQNGTIDYFKLVLYQWEDNPRDKCALTTLPLVVPSLSLSVFIHNTQYHNREQHKNPKTNHTSGAAS